MKVYCLQLDIVWEDKRQNHDRVAQMLASVRPEPGSLVVLPEMFATGFSMNVKIVTDSETAETSDFLSAAARTHEVFILGGLVTSDTAGKGRNQAVVFDPLGDEVVRYTKIQPFSPGGESQYYEAGRETALFDWGGFRVSPFICYDLRFPEHFRAAMHSGATMYAVIANWPDTRAVHWSSLLRARAIENQAMVVGVNRCGRDPGLSYAGGSVIIDASGETLIEAGDIECVVSCDVDPQSAADYRRQLPFLEDARH
jgi:predicted amidohydrolase